MARGQPSTCRTITPQCQAAVAKLRGLTALQLSARRGGALVACELWTCLQWFSARCGVIRDAGYAPRPRGGPVRDETTLSTTRAKSAGDVDDSSSLCCLMPLVHDTDLTRHTVGAMCLACYIPRMRVWRVWIAVLALCPVVARADVGGSRATGDPSGHANMDTEAAPKPRWTVAPTLGVVPSAMRAVWQPSLLSMTAAVARPIVASPSDRAADDCDPRAGPANTSQALRLAELRLNQLAARRTAGFWLLGFGVLSAAAGGSLIAFGHDQESVLAAGIATVSFGAINAVLSLGLLDLSHARQRRIVAERDHAPGEWAAQREGELVAQLQSGQFFALNSGLDVAYLTAGGLLCALAAARGGGERWELGAGLAVIGQALFLLVFDIVNWIDTSSRVTALRSL
jgi:hypothetical protein